MNIVNRPKSKGSSKPPKRRAAKCKSNTPSAPISLYRSETTKLARVDSPPSQLAPSNPAGHGLTRSDLAKMHPDLLGDAAYLRVSDKMLLPEEMRDAAALGSAHFCRQMLPADALERLALSQLLLAHGRTAWLTKLLTDQSDAPSFEVISEACERATGSFVRLMRAFGEYRRPFSSGTSVSIGQANLAHQQVVQNFPKGEARGKNGVRTRIAHKGTAVAEELSADGEGPKVIAECHPENAALEEEHGASNAQRKGEKRDEPTKARSALRKRNCL